MTRRQIQALAGATVFVVALSGTPSDARQKSNIISFKDDPQAKAAVQVARRSSNGRWFASVTK